MGNQVKMLWHTVRQLAEQGDREAMRADSLRNFHAPDVDYFCLFRSPAFTVKLYAIKGRPGYVVNPHNHRYDFQTWVLSGHLENITFHPTHVQGSAAWFEFAYRTGLAGGGRSMVYLGPTHLRSARSAIYRGEGYSFGHKSIHTIRCVQDTVLLLYQYADVNNGATQLFCRDRLLPSFDGLYTPFGAAEFNNRLDYIVETCVAHWPAPSELRSQQEASSGT
jgi:hypothetical protein